MPKATQKSVEEKLSIVLEGLRGDITIGELCRKHGISQAIYYKWRDRFLEGGKQGLLSNGQSKTGEQAKKRIEELERVIGKQTVQIQILKKNLNLD